MARRRIQPTPTASNAPDIPIHGKLLKRYSTLDLALGPDNVRASESHYAVIDDVAGFRRGHSNDYTFSLRLIDGRRLTFNPGSGTLIP